MEKQVLDNFRYERKFISSAKYDGYLDKLLKFVCKGVYETYAPRRVNSIYYDTDSFELALQNIEGYKERKKIRIRYYGNELDKKTIFFEQKNKYGDVGNKIIKVIKNKNSFDFDYNSLSKERIFDDINDHFLINFKGIRPKIFCSYFRQYFETSCRNYRFTIDRDMKFASFIGKNKLSEALRNTQKTDKEIIEFKYSIINQNNASKIIKDFPLRVTKSSKYVTALFSLGILDSDWLYAYYLWFVIVVYV